MKNNRLIFGKDILIIRRYIRAKYCKSHSTIIRIRRAINYSRARARERRWWRMREKGRETRGRAESTTGLRRGEREGEGERRGAPTALNAPRRRRPLSRCSGPLAPRAPRALLYDDVNKARTVAPKRYVCTYITRSPLFSRVWQFGRQTSEFRANTIVPIYKSE